MRDRDGRAGLALLWGAALTVGVLGVLTLAGIPFALTVLAQFFVRLIPGDLATVAIERLGHLALPSFGLGVSVAYLGISWLAGRRVADRTPMAAALWVLAPWWAAWTAAFVLQGTGDRFAFIATTTAAAGIGIAAAATTLSKQLEEEPSAPEEAPQAAPVMNIAASQSRRLLLRSGVVGVAGLALAVRSIGSTGTPARRSSAVPLLPATPAPTPIPSGGEAAFNQVGGISPLMTPLQDFYTVDEAILDPRVDLATWRLRITGMVERPAEYTFDQLAQLELAEEVRLMACISNEVGGDLAGNTTWIGPRLADLLERAGVQDGAVEVVFRSVEDFSSSHPIAHASDENAMVALAMGGAELTTSHGFPARILIPNTYGMKNPKWLTEIEVVGEPYFGYWESRSWSNEATILTQSRIDAPKAQVEVGSTATIAGVAWGGDRGVEKVEVSTDGATTWQEAELEPALSEQSWVRWRLSWTPEQPGDALLVVRATDGAGQTQPATETAPHPSGASGWHQVGISVA